MNQKKIGVMLLALLLAAMTMIPMVSAANTEDHKITQFTANQDQLDKLNALKGTDISVGEFYSIVQPEILVDMPADVKANLFKTKYVWPKVSSSDIKPKSAAARLLQTLTAIDYLSKSGTTLSYHGYGYLSSGTANFMGVGTTLVDQASGNQVGYVGATGNYVSSLNTATRTYSGTSGRIYVATTGVYTYTPYLNAQDEDWITA
jgi:hypothetical protein